MRRLSLVGGCALLITLATLGFQRVGPLSTVEGEGFCAGREACRVPALGAGFPLAYLVDDPQVSVAGRLSPAEDGFRTGAFVLNVLFHASVLLAVLAAFPRLRREQRRPRHAS